MTKYKVIKLTKFNNTTSGFDTLVADLSEIKLLGFALPNSGETPFTFNPEKFIRFILPQESPQSKNILVDPEEIVELDLSEFKEGQSQYEAGINVKVYIHQRLLGGQTKITRQVGFTYLCNNCNTEQNYKINIQVGPANSNAKLGLPEFDQIITQIEVECKYCNIKGIVRDSKLFKIVSTTGLDENIEQDVSLHEKRRWFYNLHFNYQYYLKLIFNINEYSNVGFAHQFYKCKLDLDMIQKQAYTSKTNLVFYKVSSIELTDGTVKVPSKHYPFAFEIPEGEAVKTKVKIRPDLYDIEEVPVKMSGKDHYISILRQRD